MAGRNRSPWAEAGNSGRSFEQRLRRRFSSYLGDVPEGAFPTFLEALLCESLDEPAQGRAPPPAPVAKLRGARTQHRRRRPPPA